MSPPNWIDSIRACDRCHAGGLVHVREDGARARPLFHEEGNVKARLMLVFEAPNAEDTFGVGRITVEANTDPSGTFLFERLNAIGLGPSSIYVTNSVMCLPRRQPGGKYRVKALQRGACSAHLRTAIERISPDVVASLRNEALKALNLIERHGCVLRRDVATSRPWFGRCLVPLYHTSVPARSARSELQQIADFKTLSLELERIGARGNTEERRGV